jgi:microcystin-dependent protein
MQIRPTHKETKDMSQPYVGEIRMGGWSFAPVNWSFCDGSTIAIDQNQALFNLIGTTYGGNGQTTFNVPNLLGRVPIHMGTSTSGATYIIGQLSGSETVTLQTTQIPAHSHPLTATSGPASTQPSPAGQTFAASTPNLYITPTAVTATSAASTAAGGSQPHENIMPFQCVTYIIALFGVYPPQG